MHEIVKNNWKPLKQRSKIMNINQLKSIFSKFSEYLLDQSKFGERLLGLGRNQHYFRLNNINIRQKKNQKHV